MTQKTRSMNESALNKTLFYIFTFSQFKKIERNFYYFRFNLFFFLMRSFEIKNLIRLLNLFVVSESRANSQSLIVQFLIYFQSKLFKKFGSTSICKITYF